MQRGKQIQPAATSNMNLAELMQDYLKEKQANDLATPTIYHYTKSIERFLKHLGSAPSIEVVHQRAVLGFIKELQDSGINHISINHYIRDVRAFLYWCMDAHYLQPFKIKEVKGQETIKDTPNALAHSITKYNRRRGVKDRDTSLSPLIQ